MSTLTLFASQLRLLTNPSALQSLYFLDPASAEGLARHTSAHVPETVQAMYALQGEWLAANGFTAASKLAQATMRA